MSYAHNSLPSRVERARVRRSLQSYSTGELHERAVFWRLTILADLCSGLAWPTQSIASLRKTQEANRRLRIAGSASSEHVATITSTARAEETIRHLFRPCAFSMQTNQETSMKTRKTLIRAAALCGAVLGHRLS